MNLKEPSLHLILCVAAIVVGCLIFFGVFHPNQHQGVGLIMATLGVLLLV